MKTSLLIINIFFFAMACNQQSSSQSPGGSLSTAESPDPITTIQDTTTWSGTPASNKFVYRLNHNLDSISIASINTADGALIEHDEFSTGAGSGPSEAVADASGSHLYVAQSGTDTIGHYSIDRSTGLLTWITDTATYPGPSKVVVHPNGKFLYTLHANNSQVSVHAVAPVTGALTWVSAVSVSGPGAKSLTIHPNGNFLYANSNSYIRSYTVNALTGALTYTGQQSPQLFQALKINAFSNRLYAVSGMYNYIWGFAIDLTAGTITSTSTSTPHQIYPYTNIEFSADGSYAYLTNDFKHSLEAYSINASGYLTYLNGVSLPANCSPKALNLLRADSYLFTACSDPSGKTFGFKINTDGTVSTTGKSSTLTGAEVLSMVIVEL